MSIYNTNLMSEERTQVNIIDYEDYLNKPAEDKNIQKNPSSQNQTSQSSNEDGSSDHIEEPPSVKSFETQKIEVKDALTVELEKNNYTYISLSENYQILIGFCNQTLHELINDQRTKKETKLIEQKRSSTDDDILKEEDIPQSPDELNKGLDVILIGIITQIIHNWKEFFNEVSLAGYNYELNLTFEKNLNMIVKNIFNKDIFKKNLEELILLEKEKDLEKEESIKNKLREILKKEKESNNLKFFNMLKMKLKDLILIYVNDRVSKFKNCQLKTLKDNTNYCEKQKEQIKKMILNSLKESTSKNSHIKLDIPPLPQNLTPLSNDEVLENKNIEVSALIEKNESKNENIIISKENQEKDDGQKYSKKKTKDKTNKTNDENGNRLENLFRSTINRNYVFVVKEIEKRLAKMNKKIKKVSIYDDITGNSTERFKEIFKEKISNILKRKVENEQVIDDILNDNRNLDELITLKELLNLEILDIINKFIKDEFLMLSNGTKIKINIFGLEKSDKQKEISKRITEKMTEIKDKIKEIIGCKKDRMREKSEKD